MVECKLNFEVAGSGIPAQGIPNHSKNTRVSKGKDDTEFDFTTSYKSSQVIPNDTYLRGRYREKGGGPRENQSEGNAKPGPAGGGPGFGRGGTGGFLTAGLRGRRSGDRGVIE